MKKRKRKIKITSFGSGKKIIITLLATTFILISAIIFLIAVKIKYIGKVTSTDFSTDLEWRISRVVLNYPILEMAPFISRKDRTVASFLVAIAKKESNWGKLSPEKDGKTCYNYWGYRGTYNQTDSGYSCFDSPEQAVNVVGERIRDLVEKKIDNPQKMAVAWKCGFDCSSHSFWSVKKWEWDVGYYFNKIYN